MPSVQNFMNNIKEMAFEESKLSTVYRFHNVTAIVCGKGTHLFWS
jgi:hypothetical protein